MSLGVSYQKTNDLKISCDWLSFTVLTGGWSYFWEQADSYFGVTSGVSASVPSSLFDPALRVQFSDLNFSVPMYSESAVTNMTRRQVRESGTVLKPVHNETLGYPVAEIFNASCSDGSIFRVGLLLEGKYNFSFYCTVDDWKTRIRFQSNGAGFGSAFYDEIMKGVLPSVFSVDYSESGISLFWRPCLTVASGSQLDDVAPFGSVFDTAVAEGQDFFDGFGDLLAKLRGDDVIIPGYDEAAGTYAGQDVFGAVDDVQDNTDEDLLIDIGYLTGALTDGIGIDQVIDLPIDDVIPKSVTDVLEKDIPDIEDPDKPVDPDNPDDPDKPTKPDGTKVPPGWLLPSLANKFPFCVPFDLIAIVKVFNAEPKPIYVEFPLKIDMIGFEYTFVFDFKEFEPLSNFCRIFFTIDFIIFLILITRKIIGA